MNEEIERVAEEVKAADPANIPPSTQTEPPDLNTLACQLYHAKQAESNAKKVRIAAEIAIAALVPIEGDSGSRTVDAGDGIKVTVKQGTNYKVDIAAIRMLDLPEGVSPVKFIPSDYAFDRVAYENIRENHPDVLTKLAGCVTATPAKVAVTLRLG